MSITQLADILKRRNIRKVCYFHTDHFEPWSKGINTNTVKGVERFASLSKQSRFAQRLSLFYHTFLPFRLDPMLVKESGVDAVRLGGRSEEQDRLAKMAMSPLEREGGHEIHVHIHHESWTRNTEEYSKEVSRWVNSNSTAEMDSMRLERGIMLTKEYIAQDIDRAVDRWAFIHGNWALNGSDRTICWVEDEIELLMKHGCFGDFTFPAGRSYCDPMSVKEPYTCVPVTKPKGYDTPESQPITMRRGSTPFADHRFFIWNSQIKADFSSLDYYSESNRSKFRNAPGFVKSWLEKSVLLQETLFIKTHAHSMKWEYEIDKGENPIPHLYPDIVAIFDLLEKVCEVAQVDLQVMTVNTIMAELSSLAGDTGSNPSETPLEASTQRLGVAMTQWFDGSEERSRAAGDFYKIRINTRQWLQDYEAAVVQHILEKYDPDRTRIMEIGCGLGTLTAVLGNLGYRVVGVEGDSQRAAGANWIKSAMAKYDISIDDRYVIVEGFYPDILSGSMLEDDKVNILISTNLANSFSAQNQERILKSALLFDRFILDISTFGKVRESIEEKSSLERSISQWFMHEDSIFQEGRIAIGEFKPRDPLSFAAPPVVQLPLLQEVLELGNAVCSEWLDELHQQGGTDAFMQDKLARNQLLDRREIALVQQLVLSFEPATTRIVEIGSCCGPLALLLAALGFDVIGFEGNVRRAKASDRLQKAWIGKNICLQGKLLFRPELFPKGYAGSLFLKGRRNVLLATNIVSTHSSKKQSSILAAAAGFDDVVLDLGRFGIARDESEQRFALLRGMTSTYFEAVRPLYCQGPNEIWHLRSRVS